MAANSALANTRLRFRRDAARLTAGQAVELRDAYAGMVRRPDADERSYARFTGLHGLPLPTECQHGTPLFLPWHRAFLYFFERAMRDRVPDGDPCVVELGDARRAGRAHAAGLQRQDRRRHSRTRCSRRRCPQRALQQGQSGDSPAPGPTTIRSPGNSGRQLPRASDVRSPRRDARLRDVQPASSRRCTARSTC